MLRLDPAHPPVWRTADCLQFGVDAVVMIDDPQEWQQRLVHELEQGIPDDAFDAVATVAGASALQARGFLRRLRPALETTQTQRSALTLQAPEGYPQAVADDIADAIAASGWIVERATWFGAADEAPRDDLPVIVVADHLVEPRRAAPLVARDITHLPIVFTGGRTEIGPVVVPGRTACLACVGAHRCQIDPAWPHIAAQLIGRVPPQVGTAAAWEAGMVAVRMLSEGERHGAHSLTLRDDSLRRTWRAHRPHEECLCRSLGRTETPDAPADLHRGPTTSRAYARPA